MKVDDKRLTLRQENEIFGCEVGDGSFINFKTDAFSSFIRLT